MKDSAGPIALSVRFALLTSLAGLTVGPRFALASPALASPGDAVAARIATEAPATAKVAAAPAPAAVSSRGGRLHLPGRLPLLGLGLDVGVPDGANLALVARPCPWARFQVSMGQNGISHGWRTGVTLLPFRDGPAAVIEYGHYRDGNANRVAGKLIGSSFQPSPVFERVGYDYVNLHLGLNFGYRRVVFFIQGGLSIVRGQIRDANQVLAEASSDMGGTEVSVRSDPTIKATGFAGKLGVIAYVW